MIKRKWSAAVLLCAMLAVSSTAWADTTYYLMWGTTNNITQFTSKGSQSGSTEWTWSVGNLSGGTNYYFCVSTSSSYTGNITSSSPSASDIVSSITSGKGIQEWNDGQVRKFYYFALSSAQSGVKLKYNSDTKKYTIFVGSTYTVTPSITGGSISPSTAQSVTSGSSVSFTVTPTSGYTFTSSSYSGTKSGDILQSGNTFTLTPTGSGTLSIVYSLVTTYTITASGTNCSFNESSKSIAAGGSFDFVVTPNEGYKLVSASCTNATCSPTSLGNATTATTITVSNPTAAGTLTVVTAAVSASRTPTVRIGAKPSISSDCGLTATAYFAQRGCENIDKLTLYYSSNRAFRIDGKNKTESKEISVSSPAINTSQNVTLTSAEVSEVVSPGDQLYLRFTAHNTNGTSSYSDILPVKYECGKFIKQNLSKSFKACPGEHQFNWSDMFIYPAPATWDVTLGGSDAKSDFTLSDGVMTWKTDGKSATSYTYTFTAHADGYDDASATLTISYTLPSGSVTGSITGVTATPAATADSPTKPYTEISLSAAGTTGNITLIDWTVSPATASIYSESGNTLPATAKFKAESRTTKTTYTVTATGYTATCASVSGSATIVVAPDITEECD